jgi:hypothetical protein
MSAQLIYLGCSIPELCLIAFRASYPDGYLQNGSPFLLFVNVTTFGKVQK